MRPSPTELAELLQRWQSLGLANLRETETHVMLNDLSFAEVAAFCQRADEACWPRIIVDSTGEIVSTEKLMEEFAPFEVTIEKPRDRMAVRMLTVVGFKQWLHSDHMQNSTVVAVPSLAKPFDTFALRIGPWEPIGDFFATKLENNPRKIVRETGDSRLVVSDLGPWIPRDEEEAVDAGDPYIAQWRKLAAARLIHALADEVEPDGRFLFRGPPVIRFDPPTLVENIKPEDFDALQALVRWIYVGNTDAESKRALVAAEVSRSSFSTADPSLIASHSTRLLEGARIAYQLGLNKISLDTIKALADLRKAVADETARLSEATRQLANSVAGALFTGIGVMAARLSLPIGGDAFNAAVVIVGVVLVLYVASITWSGARFLGIQRNLRLEWRERLYRYLPQAEYDRLVTIPAQSAERGYAWAAGFAILSVLILFCGLLCVAFPVILETTGAFLTKQLIWVMAWLPFTPNGSETAGGSVDAVLPLIDPPPPAGH